VTPGQWRLADSVVALLADEIGLTDWDLAARLGVSTPDIVPVLRVLYHQRRIDMCWSYTVLVPRIAEGRRAA
jgi:hypothetical protein